MLLPEGTNDAVHATELPVLLDAVEPGDVVSGAPVQGTAALGALGSTEVGIWELRGGTVTDTEVDEFFVVLSGGATIEFLDADGQTEQTTVVRAGDVMRLVAGSRTRWDVPDHIRKVYLAHA